MLNVRITRLKEKYFNTIPQITAERLVLATEAYKQFAGDAVPIFRAKVVNHIMENMTTLIMDDELIVGTETNAYKGANLHPEFQSSSWYVSDIDEFALREKDPYYISPEDRETILETLKYWEGKSMEDLSETAMPAKIKELEKDDIICVGLENGVSGETTCNHEKILTAGLRGYIEECQRNINDLIPQTMEEQAKVDFWKACIIQSEGLITYAHRMAEEAERQASICTDEKRRQELLTIADNCRVVPENPPQTFHQALQAIWFVHVYFYIEVCTTACGFGRFDQYMWSFYKKDVIDEKNITREEALELLECFYLKTCEVYEVRDNWYATAFAGYPMWQTLVVGGQTKGCVESGRSVQHGGAEYSTCGLFVTGAANLADSIAAVEKCVFEDKDLTMDELIRACDTNFEGQERLRQLLLNRPEKYGNNSAHVDAVYKEMMHYIAEAVQQWHDARGGYYAFGIDSQTMNIPHGEVTGALPDGRLAGEPFCDASSPMMGRDVNGPTATVKSVAGMTPADLHEGALYNLRFDPKGVQGEAGQEIIEGVVKTYFQDGGQHIQINVVDNETLRKAQKKPEDYKGLMVRVAGYMAYFTEFDKSAQDVIIDRTPHLSND